MTQDYNLTLNLPSTEFPMRASLPEKEPMILAEWEEKDIYSKLIERNKDKTPFTLHDGPPYANGNIHIGTATNKTLKDIVVRYKNMRGFLSRYIPGWDMHGLPTERKALMELGVDHEQLSAVEIRKLCREFANEYVNVMTGQFKRLGILGDWDRPYKTIANSFEAKQIEVFGVMAKKGYIYKGLKSVYWCKECVTALAEAEIEYEEDTVEAIYLRFLVNKDNGLFTSLNIPLEKAYFVIYTTTTWTIPANVAIALHPDYIYDIIKTDDDIYYVVAHDLLDSFCQKVSIANYTVVASKPGKDFEYITAKHPYLDRDSVVINGTHVTLELGTGAVHTAPGHGVEDFDVISEHYSELPIIVPVDDHGIMTEEAGRFAGLTTEQITKELNSHLLETGHIIAMEKIVHQYPHCWRCKQPILYRATNQWFCSVDDFKPETLAAIEQVNWSPSWGKERISGMVRDRKDWCISRQRSWGLPIPVFYCEECGEYHISDESIHAVAELFRKEGSDSWYIKDASDILPSGTCCSYCGNTTFTKETDIMDVWFDSGSSHISVPEDHPELTRPYDLYFEGSDQYRGWFQSSLLTSVALTGEAPYLNVVSHGFVVDGEGKKQSKSLGNSIEPDEVTGKYGADLLRLWVSSCDYQNDMRMSADILKQLSETYRKLRNTGRFILGNLGDFDPESVVELKLEEIDRYALFKLNNLLSLCLKSYDEYDFHSIYHAVHNFCVVDMSNFYLDVLKDRLYILNKDDPSRVAAQYTINKILTSLTLLISPILVFTSEEIWKYLPLTSGYNKESVVFNQIPDTFEVSFDEQLQEKWEKIHLLRDEVKKALETARSEKIIGASLDAKVTLTSTGEYLEFLNDIKEMLPSILIVSQVEIEECSTDNARYTIDISKADGEKCARCWVYSESVGDDSIHPTLCHRCVTILS
ncbi:MAG: isoleucine--tRNA ligase [Oscillospiraceae bacterium]|nr:isoleucine--tRNA ligase [Oscillospiraceae bacterium]